MCEGHIPDLTGPIRPIGCYPFAFGGFADVWKAEYRAEDSMAVLVAVKALRISFHGNDQDPEIFRRKFDREARVWMKLQHPRVTPFLGVCDNFVSVGIPALVSPFYANGNILKYMQNNTGVDRLQLVAEIAEGLTYLHDVDVVHGDLKSNNILINDAGQATLCDFGLSRILETSGFTTKSIGGNCRWMSPELLFPDEDSTPTIDRECNSDSVSRRTNNSTSNNAPRVTPASDVWAFGMTILEVLTERLPFAHLRADVGVILFLAKEGLPLREDYEQIPLAIWHLLQHCWDRVASKRPSMDIILRFLEESRASRSDCVDNTLDLPFGCNCGCVHEIHTDSTSPPTCAMSGSGNKYIIPPIAPPGRSSVHMHENALHFCSASHVETY
ncbi:kinase-like protein [Neolentinus lepideus HHB14362 ss-1]|uniref:Kinase-like protein n=1 Tax=Neolentinus lepideus HHB14362 ss-1 TaxID=1314782 RepID=A0A165PID8_9AGAM|nr:kinase-like protein [Neolentinus lepideus HHB14362 ss-1]